MFCWLVAVTVGAMAVAGVFVGGWVPAGMPFTGFVRCGRPMKTASGVNSDRQGSCIDEVEDGGGERTGGGGGVGEDSSDGCAVLLLYLLACWFTCVKWRKVVPVDEKFIPRRAFTC